MQWIHQSPIPGHPMEADLDCSGLGVAARFAVAGDFDGDGQPELAVAPDAAQSAGNDFWIMKYDPTARAWTHLSPIAGHPMEADLDCSGLGFPARFALAADVDGDHRDELVVVPQAGGSAGNDVWVLKFDPTTRSWAHLSPIPGHPMQADIDCSGLGIPARFIVAGDFDGDTRPELAVATDATGSAGNDFWVLKFDPVARTWAHLSPIPGHPMGADLDCSGLGSPARFAVAADFDGDDHDELAVAPQAGGSAGNDFWVLKFNPVTRAWAHLSPIPGHPMQADVDCSGVGYPARFALAADVDGDQHAELIVVPQASASAGNDLWVLKYDATARTWAHLSPIPGHPMGADIDCSGLGFPARFAVAADFDGDQHAEIAVAPEASGSAGNDFWVVKYDATARTWTHLSPIPGHPMGADIDCSTLGFGARFAIAADFDGDQRAEIAVAPQASGSAGNDFWVMKFDQPTRTWNHLSPIAEGGGRWYPTLLTLADGSVLAMSGHPLDSDTRHNNTTIETYDPIANVWNDHGEQVLVPGGYPRLHLLPNGRVFVLRLDDAQSWTWDPLASPGASWSRVNAVTPAAPGEEYGSYDKTSVLLPLEPSTGYRPVVLALSSPQPTMIDLSSALPSWQDTARRTLGGSPERDKACAVLLPDATVLVTGGQQTVNEVTTNVVTAERFDPAANTWQTLADANVPRGYHSVALLMPDGRVWTCGSDGGPGQHETRMELYSPPYLFRGARPGLSGVPASIQVGTAFSVATPQAAVIRSAVLLRCSSSTHAFNPDQRYVGLTIAARSRAQLTLDAPPNHNIAPPGFYLLFLVDQAGVPSVGSILRVD